MQCRILVNFRQQLVCHGVQSSVGCGQSHAVSSPSDQLIPSKAPTTAQGIRTGSCSQGSWQEPGRVSNQPNGWKARLQSRGLGGAVGDRDEDGDGQEV